MSADFILRPREKKKIGKKKAKIIFNAIARTLFDNATFSKNSTNLLKAPFFFYISIENPI